MTSPDGSSPPGSLAVGAFAARQALTEADAKAQMKGGTVGSFSNAQNAHASQVRIPLQAQSVTVSDHENRITILESGEQIAEFNSNDDWDKPPNMHHHILIGIAGGGSGWCSDPFRESVFGGGQGGFNEVSVADASMPATVAVIIGAGGTATSANNTTGQQGGNTTIGGTLMVAGGGPGGTTSSPNTGTGSHPEWAGNGGKGGLQGPGGSGGNGLQASGGLGGGFPAFPGQPGGDCPPGSIGPGAGGGGGGGSDVSGPGGNGGSGGFPGGGGGSGGSRYGTYSGPAGKGGNGGNGRAWIISYPGV